MSGDFFAVGQEQWGAACKLGLNPAVAFLVLARGTGRDNISTRWSADAVSRCTGISWRRAQAAIVELEKSGLVSNMTEPGKRPARKLAFPDDLNEALWLPNTLVDGVAGKSSPIARLRQWQRVDYLQAFIELYGLQDLAGDGGLPRKLIWVPFVREHLCDAGPFRVYGYSQKGTGYCSATGPLARFHDKEMPPEGWRIWTFLTALMNNGLLETVNYLAESSSADSELIHPLTGDAAAMALNIAAFRALDGLPDWVSNRQANTGYHYILPVIRDIPEPAVVGVYRLTYRPHTKLTSAWWAQHQESCQRFTSIYKAIASGDFHRAVAA